MTAQGKEGHSCKHPCCAPKFGEEATLFTNPSSTPKLCS